MPEVGPRNRAKGIHPRTWPEKRRARRSLATHIGFWVIWLGVLLGAVLYWQQVG